MVEGLIGRKIAMTQVFDDEGRVVPCTVLRVGPCVIVQRREKLLRDSKVTFHLECCIGRDITFAELRSRHDAVLIASGVYKARDIAAPGVGLPGITAALD